MYVVIGRGGSEQMESSSDRIICDDLGLSAGVIIDGQP